MPKASKRNCPAGVLLCRLACLWGMVVGGGFDAVALAQPTDDPRVLEAHLGFGGRYKIGCWTPLTIRVAGGSQSTIVIPYVRVPDGEGAITAFVGRPLELSAGGERTIDMLVRVGQLDASVEVALRDDSGETVALQVFDPGGSETWDQIEPGDAATVRHLVSVGVGDVGLKLVPQEGLANKELVDDYVLKVESVERLPRHYLAYEAIDTVLLTTSQRAAWTAIRSDDPRILALEQWVELGGRVILFCGRNSSDVLGQDGPLKRFLPARFLGMETLTDFRQLEIYSGSNDPFPGRAQAQLSVPHLAPERGDVELSVTQGETTLPLVIRARHGLGQVVVAAFDPDIPEFSKWTSRSGVLARLVGLQDESLGAEQEDYYYEYSSDLTQTLQNSMERQLESAGVVTPPFLWIVGLVLLYIALVGPGDYLLVRHVFKRMEMTWVTFPLIVVLTSAGAYWLANWMKGDDLITNQIELVDVDTTRGLVRGTLWTHVFSPAAESYTLTPAATVGTATRPNDEAVAWLGQPTIGIGGMNASALGSRWRPTSYYWSPSRDTMLGVPIEVWSTRSFVSRWHGQAELEVAADLKQTAAQGVVGTITNRSGTDLHDVVVVYRGYVWRLGDLVHGASTTIEPPSLAGRANVPRKIRTWLEQDFKLSAADQAYQRARRLEELPLAGVVKVMMFSDAAGGRKLTGSWNRYQHFVDLSHALDSDSAMLVGTSTAPRGELVRLSPDQEPLSMRSDRGHAETIYRFVLPVGPVESDPSQ